MRELKGMDVNSTAFMHMSISSSHTILARYRPHFCALLRPIVPLLAPLCPFSRHRVPHALPFISGSDNDLS
jgi:hypothetical protein